MQILHQCLGLNPLLKLSRARLIITFLLLSLFRFFTYRWMDGWGRKFYPLHNHIHMVKTHAVFSTTLQEIPHYSIRFDLFQRFAYLKFQDILMYWILLVTFHSHMKNICLPFLRAACLPGDAILCTGARDFPGSLPLRCPFIELVVPLDLSHSLHLKIKQHVFKIYVPL